MSLRYLVWNLIHHGRWHALYGSKMCTKKLTRTVRVVRVDRDVGLEATDVNNVFQEADSVEMTQLSRQDPRRRAIVKLQLSPECVSLGSLA